jgi:hypothetical protein
MTIEELIGIIRERGVRDRKYEYTFGIDGCRLLECIVDIPGFVSLLGEFKRSVIVDYISFLDAYPDPVGVMLGGGVDFVAGSIWDFVDDHPDPIRVIRVQITDSEHQYWHKGIFHKDLVAYDD